MYRIVLDPHIFIEDNIEDEDSYVYKIIQACIGGKMQAIISPEIKAETEKITENLIKDGSYLEILDEYYQSCEEVTPQQKLNVVQNKNDNKFIEAAVEANADFIVTNDSNLLDMDEYEGIRMITPEQMWSMYEDNSEENDPWSMWDGDMEE